MQNRVLFQMWKPHRENLIAHHKFYIEQAESRLQCRFKNVEEEANKHGEDWLSNHEHLFNSDRHDGSEFLQKADEERVEFYKLLTDMHCQTRLSVIAGIFHNWDKQLRDWLTKELAHSFPEQNIKVAIWKVNFQGIVDLLECLNWPIRSKLYFKRLDVCRLIVNVYKHGLGDSFEDLKKNHRNFLYDIFRDIFGDTMSEEERNDYLDYTNIKVNDADIEGFSKAIIEFWNDVPEEVYCNQVTTIPVWLEKAIRKNLNLISK